ncbi:MAG: GlsB/YeaQ/YmgE family stress response membrane protein [Thermoleophilia bacterium]|nr:GlsB/YeaQ/YmgE family stress response membrane protein [Thermoleophilia bacterium]
MVGAIILGLVAGAVARLLVPRDVFQGKGGPVSWLITLVLGLAGAYLGWLLFTKGFGIGDDDIFDLGGILGAIVGAVILLGIGTFVLRRTRRRL